MVYILGIFLPDSLHRQCVSAAKDDTLLLFSSSSFFVLIVFHNLPYIYLSSCTCRLVFGCDHFLFTYENVFIRLFICASRPHPRNAMSMLKLLLLYLLSTKYVRAQTKASTPPSSSSSSRMEENCNIYLCFSVCQCVRMCMCVLAS